MSLYQVLHELTQLIYPPRCEVCGAFSPEVFCSACREDILPLGKDLCAICGIPFQPGTRHPDTCAGCRGRERPWAFDSARAFGLHCGSLRRAVIRLKFDNRTQLVPILGEMLAQSVSPSLLASEGETHAIIPAMLHPARRRWRGFDQALLLARQLSRHTGLPVWEGAIRRVKNTHQQIGMTISQRAVNLRGAFEAAEPDRIRGAHVLLVDDVFTTGATMQAAASALKRAGAVSIHALTVTRAVPAWHPAALGGDPPENY